MLRKNNPLSVAGNIYEIVSTQAPRDKAKFWVLGWDQNILVANAQEPDQLIVYQVYQVNQFVIGSRKTYL